MKISQAFKASLLFNLLLLLLALWFWRKSASPSASPAISHPGPEVLSAQNTPVAGAPAFRWSQLESTNYLTYVANLRGIGCPEQTIRDLISADVDSYYAPKRQELRDWEIRSGQNQETRRQLLRQEEDNSIAYILGLPAATNYVPAEMAGNSAGKTNETQAALPLAYLEVNTNLVRLNEAQRSALEQLRRGFTAQLGGIDPASREYAERWQKAQPAYDQALTSLMGSRVYGAFKLQAAASATATH